MCKHLCKNGSAQGAKVGFDLHTLCEQLFNFSAT